MHRPLVPTFLQKNKSRKVNLWLVDSSFWVCLEISPCLGIFLYKWWSIKTRALFTMTEDITCLLTNALQKKQGSMARNNDCGMRLSSVVLGSWLSSVRPSVLICTHKDNECFFPKVVVRRVSCVAWHLASDQRVGCYHDQDAAAQLCLDHGSLSA